MLSGKYDDDFESTLTTEQGNPLSTDQLQSTDKSPSVEDKAVTLEEGRCGSPAEDDTLTLSFEDIGRLRRSLEGDDVIRESIATRQSNMTTEVGVAHPVKHNL